MYLRYSAGSSATINSFILTQEIMNKLLSMSTLRYAPGVSTNARSHSLNASITAEIITASVDNLGDVASDLLHYSRCLRQSENPRASIVFPRFSFRNIIISSAYISPLRRVLIF